MSLLPAAISRTSTGSGIAPDEKSLEQESVEQNFRHTSRLLPLTLAFLAGLQLISTSVFAARELKRPEEVFLYTARIDGGDVLVSWNIADGYYLYRDKMRFAAEGAELGAPVFPAGEIHADEFFGSR